MEYNLRTGLEFVKKPFYTSEFVYWGDSNDLQKPNFTRHESVASEYYSLISTKHHKRTKPETAKKHKQFHRLLLKSKEGIMENRRTLKEDKESKKKLKEDLYDVNNVIFFDSKNVTIPKKDNIKEQGNKIYIPEFKPLDKSFYKNMEEDCEMENEEESWYEEMHRPYELAESCNKFLDSGQGLPEELKGGLKIRIKLPKGPNELPSLLPL